MEVILALFALILAWWQLSLQRREIQRNGKITALVNMSGMVRDRISFYSQMIDDLKARQRPWAGHATAINQELRPLLADINQEIIELTKDYRFGFSEARLRTALRLQEDHAGDVSAPSDAG